MPRQKPTDKIAALRAKQAELAAQLKAAEARESEKQRKLDTRRKIVAGALALTHHEQNPDSEFAKVFFRLLDEYVVKKEERALFTFLSDTPETRPKPSGDTHSLKVVQPAAE
jgi:hypothetical protein